MSSPIRVAIADDHQGIIDGYLYRLGFFPQIEVVGTAMCGQDMEDLLANHATDVLILDVGLPMSSDKKNNPYPILHAIPNLLQRYRGLIILVISMHTERALIDRVMKAGHSFICHSELCYESAVCKPYISIIKIIIRNRGFQKKHTTWEIP